MVSLLMCSRRGSRPASKSCTIRESMAAFDAYVLGVRTKKGNPPAWCGISQPFQRPNGQTPDKLCRPSRSMPDSSEGGLVHRLAIIARQGGPVSHRTSRLRRCPEAERHRGGDGVRILHAPFAHART